MSTKFGAGDDEKDFNVVDSKIEQERDYLAAIAHRIWENPEIGHEEVMAHDLLTDELDKRGFQVQRHFVVPTGFKAEYTSRTGNVGSTVAVMLEYDALPGIGHACGHNLIAEAGMAAAIAVMAAMEADAGLSGKLVVFGCPAEESKGAKIDYIRAGVFETIDAALMVHPAWISCFTPPALKGFKIYVEFRGKAAHASACPWKGANALDACVACYQNIALLRQQIKPSCRVHVIITEGGSVTNIIPSVAKMTVAMRVPSEGEIPLLRDRIQSCIEGAAKATGCTVNATFEDTGYSNLLSNMEMVDIFKEYAGRLGLHETKFKSVCEIPAGSTDMGNVSHVVPSIHPMFAISTTAMNHNPEFTDAAGSPEAQDATLTAAKAMAMTALKLLRCESTLRRVKHQWRKDLEEDCMVETE